jgi:hypothetical protein
VVRGRIGRAAGTGPQVGLADYKTLHGRLLAELRSPTDAERSEPRRRLESLVEPWVTLQTLGVIDRQKLRDLVNRASLLADALSLRAPPGAVPLLTFAGLLLLVAVPLGGFASLQFGRLNWHPPSLGAVWHFIQTNPVLSLTLLLPGTVLAGLSRLLRG